MTTYMVYQADIDNFVVNGNFKSDALMKKHFDITFHGKIDGNDLFMYRPVCEIDANNLDEVFQIGNIGPEESIRRIPDTRMHSISVGDIILNMETGEWKVVAKFGFSDLPEVGKEAA